MHAPSTRDFGQPPTDWKLRLPPFFRSEREVTTIGTCNLSIPDRLTQHHPGQCQIIAKYETGFVVIVFIVSCEFLFCFGVVVVRACVRACVCVCVCVCAELAIKVQI